LGFPHGLQGFGDTRHEGIVADDEFECWECYLAAILFISCRFGLDVGGLVSPHRRDERRGVGAAGLEDAACEEFAVDSSGECAAGCGVGEGRVRGGVDAQEVALQERGNVELVGCVFSPSGDFGDGERKGRVELACAVGALFVIGVFDGEKDDAFDLRMGGVAVLRVFL